MSVTNWKEFNGRLKRVRTPPWRSRRLQDRHRALEGGPTLDMIAGVPHLMAAFEDLRRDGGRAPGPDGLRFPDVGLGELSAVMHRVADTVMSRAYVVPPSRAVKRAKKDGTFRTLSVDNIVHRALAKSAQIVLGPVLAPYMSPISHSTCGRGVHSLLASMYWAYRTGLYCFMVNHDVKKAFDSLPVNVALDAFKACVSDPGVLWLVELLLRGAGGPTKHVGIPQGMALSPLALEIALSAHFDRHWSERTDSLPAAWRYVDNLVRLATGMHEGRQAVDRCRVLLHRIGLSLKDISEEQYLIDLHGGQKTELLGFHVSSAGGSLTFDIAPTALDCPKTQDSLLSRLTKARGAPNPSLTSSAIVTGWIKAVGPTFDYERAPELTERVLRVTRMTGNREISAQHVRDAWAEAGRKWQHFLHRHRPGEHHNHCPGVV